jgi:hypothetical protein
MSVTSKILILLLLLATLTGCDYELQGAEEDSEDLIEPEEPKQITAATTDYGVITIEAEVSANSLTLSIEGAPENSRLECHLNQEPLNPCSDSAVFAKPRIGTYKISAVAIRDDAIVGIGESKSFEVAGNDNTGTSQDDDHLLLVPTLAGYTINQVHPIDQPFVPTFAFEQEPTCDATLQCAFGSTTSQFWGQCDQGDGSFTMTPEMLATGLQTVKVRALCGDKIGPELHFPINALPADYEPLKITHRADGLGRHTFELMNPLDCLEDNPRFECLEPGSEFIPCENSLENPISGTQIRYVCAADVGPAFTIE